MADMKTTRRGVLAAACASSIGAPLRGAGKRRIVPSNAINVRELGAKGDGVSDDAPAFHRAIDTAIRAGGGTIHVPAGHYLIASEAVTAAAGTALLALPFLPGGERAMILIRIVGEGAAAAFASPVPHTGSTIFTNKIAPIDSAVPPSLIGRGAAGAQPIAFSAITLELYDIAFMVDPASGMVAIDASGLQNCVLHNVSVFVDANPGSEPLPTNPRFTGIRLPGTGNHGIVKCRNVYVEGFYHGIEHSEHADIEALINQCVVALHIPHPFSHLAKYRVTTQRCSYSIRCEAAAAPAYTGSNAVWGTLDIERNPAFPFKADVFVGAGAALRGALVYNVAADPASLLTVDGAGEFDVQIENCALGYRRITGDAVVSCNGRFFPVFADVSQDVRVSVLPGLSVGQRLRLYGSERFAVTVSSIAPHAAIRFADGSERTSCTIAAGSGGAAYLELTWSGGHWLAAAVPPLGRAADANSAARQGRPVSALMECFVLVPDAPVRNAHDIPVTLCVPVRFEGDHTRAATVILSIGHAPGDLRTVWRKDMPPGMLHGMTDTATARVPAGWYYLLSIQNAAPGEATIVLG